MMKPCIIITSIILNSYCCLNTTPVFFYSFINAAEALMHITEDESIIENLNTGSDNPREDSVLDNGLEENDSVPIDEDEGITEAAEAVPEDSTVGHVVAAGN